MVTRTGAKVFWRIKTMCCAAALILRRRECREYRSCVHVVTVSGDLTTRKSLFRPPCVAGTPGPGVLEAQCKQNVMETSETFIFFNDFQIFQVAEMLTLRFRSESSKAEGALPSFCRFVASSQIRLENLMTDLMPGPACWRDGARLSGWSCLTFHDIAFKIECNKVVGPTLPSTTP